MDCVSSFNGLSRLVAAADKGQGGIELWINPEGQLSKAGFGPLGVQHCHVRASSSTWLIVECDHPLLQCIFAVAYAPQAGRATEDIEGWWKEFGRLLLPLRTKDVVLIGDFNAHIGSIETAGIGPNAWEEENLAGGWLRTTVEDCNLILPATFGSLHEGPSSTFRSASGGQSRVDFIGVPHSWISGVSASFVDLDFDLMSGDFDHYAVALEMQMKVTPVSSLTWPRRAQYDRKAARKDPCLLRQMINSMPSVPWGVGVDEHWSLLERHCAAFLTKHFPLAKRHPRQDFFSDATWSTLTSRKDIDIQIRAIDKSIAQAYIGSLFLAWKSTLSQSAGTAADSRVSLINLYQERALLLWVRTQLAARFRQQRNEDLRNFRANSALSLARDVNSGDASQVYKSLKPKRPVNRDKGFKMPRPLPGLNLDGTCQSDHNRLRYIRIWEKHFAAIEHSCVVDIEAIQNYAVRQQRQTIAERFSLEETPALSEFEQSIRQLSWRKAQVSMESEPKCGKVTLRPTGSISLHYFSRPPPGDICPSNIVVDILFRSTKIVAPHHSQRASVGFCFRIQQRRFLPKHGAGT